MPLSEDKLEEKIEELLNSEFGVKLFNLYTFSYRRSYLHTTRKLIVREMLRAMLDAEQKLDQSSTISTMHDRPGQKIMVK